MLMSDERNALVRFTERNAYFGRGVVIEVQHANEGKDIRRITADYLAADYVSAIESGPRGRGRRRRS